MSTPVDGGDDRCELQRQERKVEEEEGEQYRLRCIIWYMAVLLNIMIII